MMIPEKAFGGFSVITVAHLLQLAPVEAKRIFSQFSDKSSMKNLIGLGLTHLFEYPELTEVVRRNVYCLSTCSINFELVTPTIT